MARMRGRGRAVPAGPWRKAGTVVLVVVVALFVLLLLVAAFLASPLFERTLRSQILPRVSERIEREVTVESARSSLLPLTLRLRGVRIEGKGDYAIASAERIDLRVKIWPTLRTFGKTIALSVLRVSGAQANLVRLEDGSWDLPTLPRPPPEERRTYVVEDALVEAPEVRMQDRGASMEARNVRLEGSLTEDAASLRSLRAEVGNGVVQAVARALLGESPSFAADVELSGVDLSSFPQLAGTMDGILDATARFSGEGADRSALLSSLVGSGRMNLRDGRWLDLSFLERLTAEVAELIYVPRGARPESEEALDLGSPITAAAVLEKGWITITEPPTIRAAFGATEVTGRASLDERLDLVLDIGLSPEFLSDLTGGLVAPDEPIPVTLLVTGTTDDPKYELTNTEELEAANPGFFRRLFRSIRDLLPTGH